MLTCGSAGMQGRLRRGAHGAALLGKACYGRAWCMGEGAQAQERARADAPPTPHARAWEVVCDLVGRKILGIEKAVILELAVVFVVFVCVVWNRNQNEGFSLVEKFEIEDATSELFQFSSIQTQRQGTPFRRARHRRGQGWVPQGGSGSGVD